MDLRGLMSEAKFYESYSQYNSDTRKYETWDQSVARVMGMHKEKYADKMSPKLEGYMDEVSKDYKDQLILGAQRALQFGGSQLRKHEMKMYNCVSSHADRQEVFGEFTYMLLCGAGAGVSVQKHHVANLPRIQKRSQTVERFVIEDSIEGWKSAVQALMDSYMNLQEEDRKVIDFDYSLIRPKGSRISGGFLAPGSQPLSRALTKIEDLCKGVLKGSNKAGLRPIHVYDICMHIADAVISGGVRRSATIFLFSVSDQEMLDAKTGNWYVENPQRARSNNSAMVLRSELTFEKFQEMMIKVKEFGEPAFIFTDNLEFTYNPCVEIGKYPKTEDGRSGWQGCNLTEINGGKCKDVKTFFRACRTSAILATLQAGYTDFNHISSTTKEIFEREALIGCSITGWVNNPVVLFDKEVLRMGAKIVKDVNREVAKLIGINPAARTTCAKPSGNASVLLQTASGIHGEHSKRYLRNVQMDYSSEVAKTLLNSNPAMVETSSWNSAGTDACISFPVETPEGSLLKSDLLGVKQLELVKIAQQNWVEYGTDTELCVDPNLRHNISNTITVDDWDEVTEYVYKNRDVFAGISFMAASGDKAYNQSPFTEVLTAEQLLSVYGTSSMFASGLIVDALEAFNDNLWLAIDTYEGRGLKIDPEDTSKTSILQTAWLTRFEKFANHHHDSDTSKTANLLKDVFNLHKWEKITTQYQDVDWGELGKKDFISVDTLAGAACSGGVCEVVF